MQAVDVEVAGARWAVAPGEVFTFGRSRHCTACLEPPDEGVSRTAGSLSAQAGLWLVANTGSRPFDVVAPTGIRSPLAPGQRQVLAPGRHEVLLAGLVRRFCVAVAVAEEAGLAAPQPGAALTGVPTEAGGRVRFTAEDRLALVALFAGYLEAFPRSDHRPASYSRAAARLGWPASTLRKRIERIRGRLSDAGVPGLVGEEANERLAEHVLATRVITRADLAELSPAG